MRLRLFCLAAIFACSTPALAQTAAPAGPARSQRGDVAVSYSYVRAFPLGVAMTDGFSLSKKADGVLDVTFGRGTYAPGVSVTLVTVMGGIRGKFGSRYGAKSTGLIEVVGGYIHGGANNGVQSGGVNGFGVKFGGGGDIGVNETVSIRAMFYGLMGHLAGSTSFDPAFTLGVSFKLFK